MSEEPDVSELQFTDEAESAGSSGGGSRQTAKYEVDVTEGAGRRIAEILKARMDEGDKPKGALPLRADHEDAEPSVETFFLSELKDDVKYVGYRRKRQMEEHDYNDTETSQFTEGLGTDLWRALIREEGEAIQDVFGGTVDEPAGRLHAGSERNADLEDREKMVFRWRDTDKAKEQFTEFYEDEDESDDDDE